MRTPTNRSKGWPQAKGRGPANAKKSTEDANKKLERELDQLARQIDKYRIDSQRFLAGDLLIPPDELKERIQAEFRRLRASNIKGTAINFRLGSLESRLNSHADQLSRLTRSREQARRRVAQDKPSYDAVKGVVVGQQADSGAVEALYKGLNPKMDMTKFQTYIDRQAEVIRSKTGCKEIQFRVAVQEGKLKLKAKPIRD